MNIIKFGITCYFLLLNLLSYSQNTFSKLYPLPPLRATVMNSIVVTDTAYFITGIVSDSVFPYKVGSIFFRTDLKGNIQIARAFIDSPNQYETWFQSLTLGKDNKLITNGYNFNNIDSNLFIIKYDLNGNVVKLTSGFAILGNFEIPYPMLQLHDGFILSVLSQDVNSGNTSNYNLKLNNDGYTIWKKKINFNNPKSAVIRMTENTSGFLLGAWGSPASMTKNGLNQTVIIQFDSLGNQMWEYKSPVNEDWAGTIGGLEMSDDGDIVYASGKGTIMNPLEVSDYFTWDWCITKLGFDKKIKWRTYFKQPRRDIDENGRRLWNMLKLKDKGGYISVGTTVTDKSYGWLVKVSEAGDSIWSRTYNLEDDSTAFYEIRQAKEDKDGNLIMVGERINYEPDLYSQQGWMMKLDKYGCLVPGCHLVGTKDVEYFDINVNVYPNPASDYIAFYIDDISSEFHYTIISSDGKTMKSGKNIKSEETAIINTQEWPSGIYHLTISKKDGQQTTKKIIIQH